MCVKTGEDGAGHSMDLTSRKVSLFNILMQLDIYGSSTAAMASQGFILPARYGESFI